MSNTLLIKNMVCHRCLLAVIDILTKAAIPYQKIEVGEVFLADSITEDQYKNLSNELNSIGLELIDNRMSGTIEKIKSLLLQKARNEVSEEECRLNLSTYLSQKLYLEYTYISSLFSSVEGRTIENYFLEQRIEKVKELLVYDQMTLSNISFEMGFSSVAHLSSQFKQITGFTPSHFKKLGSVKRKLLDQI